MIADTVRLGQKRRRPAGPSFKLTGGHNATPFDATLIPREMWCEACDTAGR